MSQSFLAYLSEVLRTLFHIVTKKTDAKTDPKHTADSKTCLLTPHGHCKASGKISYSMCTILAVFQEAGPTEN